MSQMIKAYDPKKVSCSIGLQPVTGFAPDTKITIARTNNVTTVTNGIDGDISVNIDNRYTGTATISLLHNSPFNDLLTSWVLSLEATSYPFLPFEMNDPSGQAISTICWIEVQPDYAVAQETGSLEWVLGLADARLAPNQDVARLSAVSQLSRANI